MKGGWYLLFFLAIGVGIVFRFTHLSRKFFWWDETASALRMSGQYADELRAQMPLGKIFSAESLRENFQQIRGTSLDTLEGLRREEPQLPPLYFLLLRGWAHLFGPSVSSLRAFSAVTSVASLALLYSLCQLLFASPAVAIASTAITALSPLGLIYAQEARPYALMIFFTLLSSLILLRGLVREKRGQIAIYCAVTTAGIYTHLLFILVPLTHLAYLFANRHRFKNHELRRFGSAIVLAFLLGLPWLAIILGNYDQFEKTVGWVAAPLSFSDLLAAWGGQFTWPFFDIGLKEDIASQSKSLALMIAIFAPFSLAVTVYTVKRAPRDTWTFVLLLQLVAFGAMAIPDLVLGGQRTTVPRYLLSLHLGILICAGFCLANLRKGAELLTLALLAAQIWSCNLILKSNNWWHKGLLNHAKVRATALRLEDEEDHLVIVEAPNLDLLSLSLIRTERTHFLVDTRAFRAGALLANAAPVSLGVGRLERIGQFLVYSSKAGAPLPLVSDFTADGG